MKKESLHLWCANPGDFLPDAIIEACVSMLSEDEQAHWRSYRFDKHRREYLITRVLVRTALSYFHPLAPAAWRFESNIYGKPFVVPDCGLRFNLSNSPGLVVCLISQGAEVGVDAQPGESGERIAELGPEVFSPLELAQLVGMRRAEKSDRALSLWTLKEAYIKARGMGLTLSLNKVSFLYGGLEGIRLELDPRLDDRAGGLRFCLLEHAGHRIAVMAQGVAAFDLQLMEMRPPPASASRLTDVPKQWFPLRPVDQVGALEEE
jgi:4'-phosphopantetheinyl transferase